VPTLERVKLAPVMLFDHNTAPVVQVAVKITLFGEQTIASLGVLTVGAFGLAFISTFLAILASDSQPLETHLAVIEYVPTLERGRLVPVVLFDQTTVPVVQVAVKVTLFGKQTTDWLGVLTVGTLGLAFISIFLAVLTSDSQPLETHLAVMA